MFEAISKPPAFYILGVSSMNGRRKELLEEQHKAKMKQAKEPKHVD